MRNKEAYLLTDLKKRRTFVHNSLESFFYLPTRQLQFLTCIFCLRSRYIYK